MRNYTHDLAIMADDVRDAYERRNYRASTRFFTYQTPRVDTGGTPFIPVEATTQIDGDSLFVWCGITGTLRDEHPAVSGGAAVFFRITILSSLYQLTGKDFTPWGACTGVGEAPHVFGIPIILVPGERVRVEWEVVEEQGQGSQLTLIGFKLFTQPYTREILQAVHDQAITFDEKAAEA